MSDDASASALPNDDQDKQVSPRFPLHVVLYQPEIPQNAGNIARTCVAVGAKLWMVRPLGFRLTDRYLRRAGLDYWQHLHLELVDNWSTLTRHLADRPMWLFSRHAHQYYTDVYYQQGGVMVFGGETQGLPAGVREAGEGVRIPTTENVRSLNLANSVAIAVYEAVRQLQLALG
ncbi:MAG: tRNA (cytidine(34)-2'-O)-methyltransferase [Planctomycetales bacterium]|nr:tRNA (cytidine(34)-2'-O)-methyltransferase [Planctomycetales bacterium]